MVNFLVFEINIPVSLKFYISCIFQNCIMLQKYGTTMMISSITTYRKSFSVEGYRYIKPIFIYMMAKKNECITKPPGSWSKNCILSRIFDCKHWQNWKAMKSVLIYRCKLQVLIVILWTIWNCFMIIRLEPTKFSYNKK